MNSLQYTTNDTPDGEFHIIFDHDGAARASGFGEIGALQKRLPEELRAMTLLEVKGHIYQKNVDAYYDGDKSALSKIPYSQTGTVFQKKVWDVISDIPYGKTISYKELAKKSGNPAAVRAAGTVCGLNRLILLIPCHRILKSNGEIGSYLYGSLVKESLLRREGTVVASELL